MVIIKDFYGPNWTPNACFLSSWQGGPSPAQLPNPALGFNVNTDPVGRFSYTKSPLLLVLETSSALPRAAKPTGSEKRPRTALLPVPRGRGNARCAHTSSSLLLTESNYLTGAAFYKVCFWKIWWINVQLRNLRDY